jgi:hypothetical protein
MRRLFAAFLGTAICVSTVPAAPRAESAQECGIAADMALVARSLAQERIEHPKADAIMARIYDVSDSARGKELMMHILESAYAPARGPAGKTAEVPAMKFAQELFAICIKTGGDMSPILGRRS